MNLHAIYHRAGGAFAYPVGEATLEIRLRAAAGELKRVLAVVEDRYRPPGSEEILELHPAGRDRYFEYFQGRLQLSSGRFRYAFWLDDGVQATWYGETGFFEDFPPAGAHFQYPYMTASGAFTVPDWVRETVFYQIFPDRFANGDRHNDPPETEKWGASPQGGSFFGGDLQGIIDRLPYLADLGVTALYLTPVFAAPTNHKYDTADYYRIDPHFGDIDAFKRLVTACHDRGVRVVLDAVFNHCGQEFFAFQDVVKNGQASPYAGWFHIESFPVRTTPPCNYETFANDLPMHPKLATENSEVQDYLLGVTRYWMEEAGIDGWRLDVANEVDRTFWRRFRQVVKETKSDAYIVGEVWHESSDWLLGDTFDAVMNYRFRDACIDFFGNGSIRARSFDYRLARVRFTYPDPVNAAMFNLLGSHDTPRILTLCGGHRQRAALAAVFLLTYPGVPSIYYGDEIGMEGWGDPDCRRTMIWEAEGQDAGLLDTCKRLIRVRKQSPTLRHGAYRTLLADPVTNVYAVYRYLADGNPLNHQVVTVFNNGGVGRKALLELPVGANTAGPWIDVLTGRQVECRGDQLDLDVPAWHSVVLFSPGGVVV